MKSILKIQSIALVLLLLCSVCVVPAMAGTETFTIEDGVHLIKSDTSVTRLNQQFYHIESSADVVVDGDQYYWVRIGSVVSKGLTSVWWSPFAAIFLLLILGSVLAYGYCLLLKRCFPEHYNTTSNRWQSTTALFVFILPLVVIAGLTFGNLVVVEKVSIAINEVVYDGFVDVKASDDTILLKVDKLHPETNTLYMKSGVNLTTLTHLSGSGTILNTSGVKPA